EIILLDEPAAGLSKDERLALEALLRRLRDEGGRTVVVVEHDLELVWRVADEVVVMDNGRIVASGPPHSMRTNDNVKKLFVSVAHA
ncbi:ABC transporter, partial [Rhizobiaceae sp. 2RAB30]